ncbi:Ppx/GppA phosphatase family protein [Chryseosolibacter indicus]|uniref:Exopolyphosphatase n=1 Tax=Chryseosolibacter indicus TaxID=2782351 RepID=A0ABS5VL05_9BACT|nr:exopolyphosphatase [Chryseosolibacter indicus]MBT1702120.1 exopolyphosphatase [Chryseosolibacter indicus]
MKDKIAIIDMGTNTFHLLIAQRESDQFNIIYRDRLAVKIGMGGINDGYITEGGIHRALLAMQSFKNIMKEHGVQEAFAFGTSAMRNAKNGEEVVKRIKDLTGIKVNVISGDEEAYYIYMGVKAALGLGDDRALIVDIGGGSVEFIIANQDRISWKQSFEIGAQRLLERFQKHDPILQEEILELNAYFDKSLQPLFTAMEEFKPQVLVGSSGTFDTLSDIFCIKHDIHKTAEEVETPLTLEGFYDIYRELLTKKREDRMKIPGMIEMRVDMIVVACCLVNYLFDKFIFNRIRVSTYSLKEGVLAHVSQGSIR